MELKLDSWQQILARAMFMGTDNLAVIEHSAVNQYAIE